MSETNDNMSRLVISKVIGGAIFCGAMGALAYPWIGRSVLSVANGLLFGSIVGVFIAICFDKPQSELLSLVFPNQYPCVSKNKHATGLARGLGLASFVCLFLGVPFLVFCSVIICTLLTITAVILSGGSAGLETLTYLANGSFWFTGLYLHVVLLLAVMFWCVKRLLRRRRKT